MPSFINLVGKRFGRLVVTQWLPHKATRGSSKWIAVCDCGTRKEVATVNLRSGDTQSCGCLQRETITRLKTTHGMSDSPEYQAWSHMRRRCQNQKDKSYQRYGGRGIAVCRRWNRSFQAFYKDMGPRPAAGFTLERLDNTKGYYKNNCCWATSEIQNNNKRNNVLVSIDGVSKSIGQWARLSGVRYATIYRRVKTGFPEELILSHRRMIGTTMGKSRKKTHNGNIN